VTKFLLSLHVLAAIIAVGPVAVAASMFPRTLRRSRETPDASATLSALSTLGVLHRVCRVYAAVGIAVPLFGFATASSLGVLGSAWLITAITLTAAAAGVLALVILPAQQAALSAADETAEASEPAKAAVKAGAAKTASRLAAATGVFNLLWATVTVLMIVRPGSTTGA
jgi:nucleoside permease NupC